MPLLYQVRKIEFQETISVGEWQVKIYTIAKDIEMDTSKSYQKSVNKLPEWLALKNDFDSSHDKIAFLIVHIGTEGIFSIINWWVGKNMLNTHIFISKHESPEQSTKISGSGLAPCVWELEIIHHESKYWVKNSLQKATNPDYEKYLNDTLNCII